MRVDLHEQAEREIIKDCSFEAGSIKRTATHTHHQQMVRDGDTAAVVVIFSCLVQDPQAISPAQS